MVDYARNGHLGDMECGEGVQVVKLGEGERRYELDEEALRRVLLREDVRGLPVVVVSVAGAYRGGKSFILDFFLRYLNAPRSSQVNGEWLGSEDEPLKGFHWRGGGDRDTTGINLWSKPIISTLPNGEKVAVVLMDTQGTFDSETTIGQNSTIFALSTLISSVQIYNLSGNIKEDDLQHLQLFTEYGKLACAIDTDSKPFQTLLFLVRDWPNAFEHPYGFHGGSTLLNKRLQTNTKQKTELREVREHIRSCFDKVICCLMPHPGLTVNNQFFAGCLRDLTPDFRRTLLELVPSLFEPTRLIPKMVTGQVIQCQDLFDYFQKYLNIFNSDDLPEAVTILKATADACLLSATREARDLYSQHMEARVRDGVSVSSATLTAWHEAARDLALKRFTEKKKLAAQADVDAHLDALKMELVACQSQHNRDNEFKVQDTMSLAKIAYEAAVSRVCAVHARLCLHPRDMDDLHAEGLRQALEIFDAARDVPQGEEDIKKTNLLENLEQLHENLSLINNRNNLNAVWEGRDVYVRRMKLDMDHTGVSSERLNSQHQDALKKAKTAFYSMRSLTALTHCTQHENDVFLERLLQEISTSFMDLDKANEYSNMVAMQAAENSYNNIITAAWGPQTCCFHPRALEDLHKQAVNDVMAQILAKRPERDTTEFKTAVNQIFENRYKELKKINVYYNEQAVDYAVLTYESKRKYLNVSLFGFFNKLITKHDDAKRQAIKEFMNRRRGTDYNNDPFYDDLLRKIEEVNNSL